MFSNVMIEHMYLRRDICKLRNRGRDDSEKKDALVS